MSSAPALESTTAPGSTEAAAPGPGLGPDPFVAGEVVDGRYLLLDRIGQGGSCSVWRARDEILRRDVAIKRLVGNPAWSPAQADAARLRAQREGRVAARLHHPRLAAIFDLTEASGEVCLVMELVDAPPLSRLVESRGPLDPTLVTRVGAQVAEGLAAAHAAGVLHRDVKPANVLVDADGTATLTDFGVARLADDTSTTSSGRLTGTPHFMAPEIARGGPATEAADVYSLGATLFLAIEGQPPTGHGPSALDTLRRVAAGQILPMHRAGPLTPALAHLLDLDPARRPAASEVGDLLRSAVGMAPEPVPDRLSAHPRTLVDQQPVRSAASVPAPDSTSLRQTTPVAVHAPVSPDRARRRRRVAVGSLLGAAGLAGAVGGVVAVSNASSTPVAATEAATPAPHVDAPVTPPAVPASAPPITPVPDVPITDLGPTVEPPAPALVVQADPSDDGGSSRGRHRSSGDGDDNDGDKGHDRGHHGKGDDGDDAGGKHRSHSDDDGGHGGHDKKDSGDD